MKNIAERNYKLGMIARKIVEDNKGILAADESPSSLDSRFSKHGIENNVENRRIFRQIMLQASFKNRIGGVIFHEETFEQSCDNGVSFIDLLISQGISPGIKCDKGLIDFKDSEKVSVGLEDLEKRLSKECYRKAEFAKWRSVFTITTKAPTEECIVENCSVLARYAEICQKFGIVPIVEPELLWSGRHTISEAEQITKTILGCLNYHLNLNGVYMAGVLIKPAFVTAGKDYPQTLDVKDSVCRTFQCLIDTIPVAVPGVVFLSGGHTSNESIKLLNAINNLKGMRTWKMSFSYGRAFSEPVLSEWQGKPENIHKATQVFEERLEKIYLASNGKYTEVKKGSEEEDVIDVTKPENK